MMSIKTLDRLFTVCIIVAAIVFCVILHVGIVVQ